MPGATTILGVVVAVVPTASSSPAVPMGEIRSLLIAPHTSERSQLGL